MHGFPWEIHVLSRRLLLQATVHAGMGRWLQRQHPTPNQHPAPVLWWAAASVSCGSLLIVLVVRFLWLFYMWYWLKRAFPFLLSKYFHIISGKHLETTCINTFQFSFERYGIVLSPDSRFSGGLNDGLKPRLNNRIRHRGHSYQQC